jgi:hypothetical protein
MASNAIVSERVDLSGSESPLVPKDAWDRGGKNIRSHWRRTAAEWRAFDGALDYARRAPSPEGSLEVF